MARTFSPLVLVSIVTLIWPNFAEAGAGGLRERIDTLVRQNFLESGPGVAILVSRNGTPIFMEGYGLADVRSGERISADSLFDLASVSKHFTAMALLTLAQKGKVDLNSSVKEILPDFNVPVRGRQITLRDLLHHVSGLRDYSIDYAGSDRQFAALTTETHLKWLNRTVPTRPPGERFEYNNSNYVLLSLIVERISGMRYATYAQEKLFQPSGMDKTRVYDGNKPLPLHTVSGYYVRRGKIHSSYYLTDVTGDGNVYTSVRELARWDRALREHKLISRRMQDLAWTNGRLDNGNPIREYGIGYGFGWEIESHQIVSHTGDWYGTSTYISMNLRSGLTVVVLSNDENADTYSIGRAISRYLE